MNTNENPAVPGPPSIQIQNQKKGNAAQPPPALPYTAPAPAPASPFPYFTLPALSTLLPTAAMKSVSMAPSSPGPGLWGFFNAFAFLLLVAGILVGVAYGMTHVGNVKHVRKNWKHYRCQPAYMPFASFYGFNTAENFDFCMKTIFTSHSEDITSSFGSVLGIFGTIMSVVMDGVNALRSTVSTIGGGINVVFQDFTDRIGFFFFNLRLSAMRIKNLIGRMYAIMFAVLYMGMSGITGGMNFSNTILFSFLDTFCFPPETRVLIRGRGEVALQDVRVGEVLVPGGARITAKFHFAAGGQPMVRLGDVSVSTNHYVQYAGRWIKAVDHPEAVLLGPYERESLICLNTDTHTIPIGSYLFRDYDEIDTANTESMRSIEATVNATAEATGSASPVPYSFKDCNTAVQRSTRIRMKDGSTKQARQIGIGDELASGGKVVGIVHREQTEFCIVPAVATPVSASSASASSASATSVSATPAVAGVRQRAKPKALVTEGTVEFLSPATLLWNQETCRWQRAGELYTPVCIEKNYWHSKSPMVFLSFIVTPNSQIELASGIRIRDYMELCSPDAEAPFARDLEALQEAVTQALPQATPSTVTPIVAPPITPISTDRDGTGE